jgi:hypothetical protein
MGVSGGPYIVRDSSLVLELDAADRNSYVSGSTIWNDISLNNNSGSLINGPTFSSASLGGIVFDGVNDHVNSTNTILGASPSTYEMVVKINARTNSNVENAFFTAGIESPNRMRLYFMRNNNFAVAYYDNDFTFSYSVQVGVIYDVCFVESGTGTVSLYVNGSFIQSTNLTAPNTLGTSLYIGRYATIYLNAEVYNAKIYNRVLSAQEVLQNYNAQKSRFGLK